MMCWCRDTQALTVQGVRQDDWDHYFELIEQGRLPLEANGVGLEDYYEYMQARFCTHTKTHGCAK